MLITVALEVGKALEIPVETAMKMGLINRPKCATCRNALNFPNCCNEDTNGKFVPITECENYEKMTGREYIAFRGGNSKHRTSIQNVHWLYAETILRRLYEKIRERSKAENK